MWGKASFQDPCHFRCACDHVRKVLLGEGDAPRAGDEARAFASRGDGGLAIFLSPAALEAFPELLARLGGALVSEAPEHVTMERATPDGTTLWQLT